LLTPVGNDRERTLIGEQVLASRSKRPEATPPFSEPAAPQPAIQQQQQVQPDDEKKE